MSAISRCFFAVARTARIGKEVINTFILPKNEQKNDYEKVGDVEFSIMCPKLNKLAVVFVNPKVFYKKYLASETVIEEVVGEIISQK